jgi:hypothetical protein
LLMLKTSILTFTKFITLGLMLHGGRTILCGSTSGPLPTPFYLFSEISCLWLGYSVMVYWVQEHWGWNHKFSTSGVYDVCYQAEVSYFLMPPLMCATCPSGLIVKCYQCEEQQHSGLILKNLWIVASHQTYVHPVVQFICSFTFAVS